MTALTARAWAPGRVNLIGEHVDYNEGIVLPIAIDRGCLAMVSSREDNRLVIRSAQHPAESVDVMMGDLAPGAVTGWGGYAAGAVWSMEVPPARGLDVLIDADVPAGAGLSSSAAVTCSVAMAVDSLVGGGHSRREIARRAQRAENDFVGVPTGSMDQVVSMLAQADHALRFDVQNDTVEQVPFSLPGMTLIVIDTRARHELIDGGYASRRAACEQAAGILKVRSLREVSSVDALSSLPPELLRRARHVVREIWRVEESVAALRAGDAQTFGELMTASHASLRDDFEVSCPELDVAVASACAAGAIGARMTGGGFGGSAIALVPTPKCDSVADHIRQEFATRGFATPQILHVRPGSGARAEA